MRSKLVSIAICWACVLIVGFTVPPTALASTIAVPTGSDAIVNGTNLQAALNSALCGDTVLLQAGATYQAYGFTFPYKGACTGTDADYITITTSATLPSGRLNPIVSGSLLAKIRVSGSSISQQANAHHYRLIGLDISTTGDTTHYVSDLVHWGQEGSGSGGYPTYNEILAAKEFVVDRCFIHPAEITANQLVNNTVLYRTSGRGLALNGVNVAVQNSYIAGFTGFYYGTTTKIDSYGIYMTAGPGPLTITNNYIEAGFNCIFLGGSDPPTLNTATLSAGATMTQATFSNVANLSVGDYVALYLTAPYAFYSMTTQWAVVQVTNIAGNVVRYQPIGPSGLPQAPATPGEARWKGMRIDGGVTITKNTLYKQPQWAVDFPGLGKMYVEIKQVVGLTIDGNIVDGGLPSAIFGMTARNQAGAAPWMTIQNVTITSNLICASGVHQRIQLTDNQATSTPGSNVTITNNLIGPTSEQVFQTERGDTVLITHNTVRGSYTAPVANSGPAAVQYGQQGGVTNFTMRDNIFSFGLYGFNANSPNGYTGAWPPSGIAEQKNVVINSLGITEPGPTWPGQMPNSFIVANDAAVGFVNFSSADSGRDYHGYALASTSPFKGMASDGKDPGVDFGALDAALRGGAVSAPIATQLK